MINSRINHFSAWIMGSLAATVLVLVIAFLIITPAKAGRDNQETETYCLSCHSNPELSMALPDGEKLALYVSPETLTNSVHSPVGIECQACHTTIKTYPHETIQFQNRRELSRSYYLACQKCHPANYAKTLDSMHAQVAEQGNLAAPICTDCHGAHDVRSPNEPRVKISETCGKCHAEIYNQYKQSIHGAALISQDNPDVPVCTDCHGVHSIQDSRTALFRIKSPDLCANCHGNKAMMDKYGLPSDYYNLYKISWHGVDVSVYQAKWPNIWHESAVCTDCHGIHDILKPDDSMSSVNSENLLTTCKKCHPQAGPNWTGAWTGHNKISQKRTPFLFYVDAFYVSFAPFVLWLTVIYVFLQVIRHTVDRVKRSLP